MQTATMNSLGMKWVFKILLIAMFVLTVILFLHTEETFLRGINGYVSYERGFGGMRNGGTTQLISDDIIGPEKLWSLIQNGVDRIGTFCQDELQEIKRLSTSTNTKKKIDYVLEDCNNQHIMTSDYINRFRRVAIFNSVTGPSTEAEILRRRIRECVLNMGYFYCGKLREIHHLGNRKVQSKVAQSLEEFRLVHRNLATLVDYYNLKQVNTSNEVWRANEANSLNDLVQRRIQYIQEPSNCSAARKIVCNLRKHCGFGCSSNYVSFCLMLAYATERTLIFSSNNWVYGNNGWNKFFLPFSKTCTNTESKTQAEWSETNYNNEKVIRFLKHEGTDTPYRGELPISIPEDLSGRLIRFHGLPIAWWHGQLVKYVSRLQPNYTVEFEQTAKEIGFQHPIVGVHIRRQDKLEYEAEYFPLEEYMFHVEEYYERLEAVRTVDKRRVYLASDEFNIFEEARKKYPQYVFVTNERNITEAERYSNGGLHYIIRDIYFLSLGDFLVCTFSSNVGKQAFQRMQTLHPDASESYVSLDKKFSYTSMVNVTEVAIRKHVPRYGNELAMTPGDILSTWRDHLDGDNHLKFPPMRFPIYKAVRIVKTVDLPTYPEVPLTL